MEVGETETSMQQTFFPLCRNTARVLWCILVRTGYVYFALRKRFIHRGQFLNDSCSSLQSDGLACRQVGESNRRCSGMPRVDVLALQLKILRFIFEFTYDIWRRCFWKLFPSARGHAWHLPSTFFMAHRISASEIAGSTFCRISRRSPSVRALLPHPLFFNTLHKYKISLRRIWRTMEP